MLTSTARKRSTLAGVAGLCAAATGLTGLAAAAQGFEAPGTTSRVSVSGAEAQSNDFSQGTALSANGRFVVFTSYATNLVAGDTNGTSDVFVRDLATSRTERVSLSSAERQANQDTSTELGLAISADGRYVAFSSPATNLVAHDTNGNVDVFVRDRKGGTTRRVSLTDGDRQGGLGGTNPSISADGRLVAFSSFSRNLVRHDTNGHQDVFVRDRSRGTTRRVSLTSADKQVYLGGDRPAISAGGSYVAFVSDSRSLVPGDTNRTRDVFMRDRSKGTTTRVSLATDETQLRKTVWGAPTLSEGGRYVGFVSGSSVLVRDRTAGTTQDVAQGNGTAGGAPQSDDSPVRLSGDGRFVVFTSFAALVAGDTNNRYDVFVRDRTAGTLERASVSSAGTEGHGSSREGAISDDGRVVAFQSEAPDLAAADTNATVDVFVRRR
jgi:Tol biopolymer transport system component